MRTRICCKPIINRAQGQTKNEPTFALSHLTARTTSSAVHVETSSITITPISTSEIFPVFAFLTDCIIFFSEIRIKWNSLPQLNINIGIVPSGPCFERLFEGESSGAEVGSSTEGNQAIEPFHLSLGPLSSLSRRRRRYHVVGLGFRPTITNFAGVTIAMRLYPSVL